MEENKNLEGNIIKKLKSRSPLQNAASIAAIISAIIGLIVLFLNIFSKQSSIDSSSWIISIALIIIGAVVIVPMILDYKDRNRLIDWNKAILDLSINKTYFEGQGKIYVDVHNSIVNSLYLCAIYEGKKEFAEELLNKFLIVKK